MVTRKVSLPRCNFCVVGSLKALVMWALVGDRVPLKAPLKARVPLAPEGPSVSVRFRAYGLLVNVSRVPGRAELNVDRLAAIMSELPVTFPEGVERLMPPVLAPSAETDRGVLPQL